MKPFEIDLRDWRAVYGSKSMGRCYFCNVKVGSDYFCHGCKSYVCEGCDIQKPDGGHDPEDHRIEGQEDEY